MAESLNSFEELKEDMASWGKWVAYTIFAFLAVFLVIIFFKSEFLDKFIKWTEVILGIVAAGGVGYVIFKIYNK